MIDRYYIYGITSMGSAEFLTACSVGVEAGPVELLPIGRLRVVASTLGDRDILPVRRNTIGHTKVLEELMGRQMTVLPMQFGVVIDSLESIGRVILPRETQLFGLLANLDGKMEVGITVKFNREALFQEIAAERPNVSSRSRALQSKDEVKSYHDRVALGQEVERLVRAQNEADRNEILACIKPFCLDHKELKITDDMTVLRTACLIDAKTEPELYETVESFSKKRHMRCDISYLAPVPPYNFVRANLDWGHVAD
jgi:hypothetical protein